MPLSTRPPAPFLETLLDNAIAITEADYGNIQMLSPDRKGLVIVAQRGFKAPFLEHFKWVELREDSSVCGRAGRNAARFMVLDVASDPAMQNHLEVARAVPFRAVQSTPLFGKYSELIGMVSTHFKEPRLPAKEQFLALDAYLADAVKTLLGQPSFA